MMLGPSSAPSSPPDTPTPMKRMPFAAHSSVRRTVSGKCELPASMMMSPSSSSGVSSSITASTGLPALTITMIRRGVSSALTKSSVVSQPVNGPSSPYSFMNSVVFAVVRLCTAVGVPRRAMLRARLAPITASPVTPIRLLPVGSVIALPRCGAERPRSRALRWVTDAHVTTSVAAAHDPAAAFRRSATDASPAPAAPSSGRRQAAGCTASPPGSPNATTAGARSAPRAPA